MLLSILFVILTIIDIVSTKQILKLGGWEANPIVRLTMRCGLFIPVKIISTIFIVFLISSTDSLLIGLICCGILSVFCINNCYQLYMYNKESQAS